MTDFYQNDLEKIRRIHHDLSAIIRSFRYMTKEVAKDFAPDSPTDQRKMEVLEAHLERLHEIKDYFTAALASEE